MPSQRETINQVSLQQWRGVDQRTQPTLVQEGFFISAKGVFFGLGDNAERLPGKKLSGVIDGPVFNIFQFGDLAILQSFNKLYAVPVAELIAFEIIPTVGDFRLTEGGDTRITEDGDTRIIE